MGGLVGPAVQAGSRAGSFQLANKLAWAVMAGWAVLTVRAVSVVSRQAGMCGPAGGSVLVLSVRGGPVATGPSRVPSGCTQIQAPGLPSNR